MRWPYVAIKKLPTTPFPNRNFCSRSNRKESDELLTHFNSLPHPKPPPKSSKSLADTGLSGLRMMNTHVRTFCSSGMSPPSHWVSEVKFFPNSRLIFKNNKPQKPSIEFKNGCRAIDVMMGLTAVAANWQAYKCYRDIAHAASNSPHSIYKETYKAMMKF